jgi:cyclic beta-1,2-glucan synthetase
VLGTVQVQTPDRAMDIMLNGWLLYQTLACRMWARSGFYQASGAYGFRDQLQDGMALAVARPKLTREHLLRAAGAPVRRGRRPALVAAAPGQGVRTRISDDRSGSPTSGALRRGHRRPARRPRRDFPFLDGRDFADRRARRLLPAEVTPTGRQPSSSTAPARSTRSLPVGAHGLPLIGAGDWNDGMNRVGEAGPGESVWLGWFLHAALDAIRAACRGRGEAARAARWRAPPRGARAAVERCNGWDGDWYRRGYFDDGTPLGSAASEECRIDSIAQSWA